ncbi:DNA topoisomerase family protein [Pseudoalteromonas tunicata]|uniref:DNA topoisomerase family protein n=1 Tax=Pseudoalteromonas tunicata TaxID=314281 RepID=UPI00273F4526|nr:topoisomerase DNA-binding C4 zinc finger domain-containing protein [Pseudoalteromonas tunicata]MDP4982810.1 topoisomerase DNA-binding C4 zinc finger domain-containing protein [Pseudoalteromonas tunicata]MDP5215135.1 topoisomerase DNA-binding C4 zinc finger domain-containing protein [Pseudoalteromonas tunicata]
MSKIDHALFSAHEHALEKEYEICPLCGSELVIRHSKTGPFIGCASYPSCEFSKPLVEHEVESLKVLADTACPECSRPLEVKNGRYGMFIGCTGFPECHYIVHEEAEAQLALPTCPKCQKAHLVKRSNKSGKSFYSCDAYPTCKYIVNFLPVDESCPSCGWAIMLEKNMASGKVHLCPQKACGFKQKIS